MNCEKWKWTSFFGRWQGVLWCLATTPPHWLLPPASTTLLILEMSPTAQQAICCLLGWNLTLGVCESIRFFSILQVAFFCTVDSNGWRCLRERRHESQSVQSWSKTFHFLLHYQSRQTTRTAQELSLWYQTRALGLYSFRNWNILCTSVGIQKFRALKRLYPIHPFL